MHCKPQETIRDGGDECARLATMATTTMARTHMMSMSEVPTAETPDSTQLRLPLLPVPNCCSIDPQLYSTLSAAAQYLDITPHHALQQCDKTSDASCCTSINIKFPSLLQQCVPVRVLDSTFYPVLCRTSTPTTPHSGWPAPPELLTSPA